MADRLPPELWYQIFDLAADEDVIFYPGLQTSMAQSTWSRAVYGKWKVRTPQDTINIIQRRSYATKKVSSTVSHVWRSRTSSRPDLGHHQNMQTMETARDGISRPLSLL